MMNPVHELFIVFQCQESCIGTVHTVHENDLYIIVHYNHKSHPVKDMKLTYAVFLLQCRVLFFCFS